MAAAGAAKTASSDAAGTTSAAAASCAEAAATTTTTSTPCGVGVELGDFDLLGEAGSGGYGRVYRVRRRATTTTRNADGGTEVVDGGVEYALKVLKKKNIGKSNEVSHLKSEADILKAVNHPFVVSLSYTFQTPSLLCFVMEFASGGDLHSRLVTVCSMNESQAKFYVCEIILGLEYLHSLGVVFRDLKPENVLIEGSGHVKLCDFGLSRLVTSSRSGSRRTRTYCGTVEYMAPEVIGREGHSFPVDWWAVGVLFFDLTCGAPPFFVDDLMDESGEVVVLSGKQQTAQRILHEELAFPKHAALSRRAKEVISALLKKDERKRLGTTTRVREHKYFEGVDWERVLEKNVRPPFVPASYNDDHHLVGWGQPATEDAVMWTKKKNNRSRSSSSSGGGGGGESSSSRSSSGNRSGRNVAEAAVAREEREAVFKNFDWVCPDLMTSAQRECAGGEPRRRSVSKGQVVADEEMMMMMTTTSQCSSSLSSSSPPPLIRSDEDDNNSVGDEGSPGSGRGGGDVYLRSVEEEQEEMRRILHMLQESANQNSNNNNNAQQTVKQQKKKKKWGEEPVQLQQQQQQHHSTLMDNNGYNNVVVGGEGCSSGNNYVMNVVATGTCYVGAYNENYNYGGAENAGSHNVVGAPVGGWGLWGGVGGFYSGVSILRDSTNTQHQVGYGAIGMKMSVPVIRGGGGAFNDDNGTTAQTETENEDHSGSYKLFGDSYPLKNLLRASRL